VSLPKRKRVSDPNVINMPADYDRVVAALSNPEAEAAVLGAVLRDPSVYASVSEILQPADFMSLWNGYVWYAFDRITERGAAIDLVTVADELDAQKQLQANSMDTLAEYVTNAPRAHSAETYAQIISDNALRLRIVREADNMKEIALNKRDFRHRDRLIDECNRRLFEATDQVIPTESTSLSDIIVRYSALVEDAMTTGERRGVRSGLSNLDDMLRGAVPGELTIIAGAEGMGKTTFALSLARSMAQLGYSLAIFTLEMSQEEIARKLIGMESGIANRALKALDLTSAQWAKFVAASGVVGQWSIEIIDDFPTLSPIQLRRRLRTLIQAKKQHIDAVIVDGLWLMQPTEPTPERHEAVGNITRDVIQVARDFNVPIYLTHQYNGEARQRRNKRPMIHDLAESAGVRRNAQVILGLYRDSYYGEEAVSDNGMTELHCLKDRNGSGAQGRSINFFFDLGKALFLPAADPDVHEAGYGHE